MTLSQLTFEDPLRNIMGTTGKSWFQQQVSKFLVGHGKYLPPQPQVTSDDMRILYCRLIMEEAFELMEAAGVSVYLRDNFNKATVNYRDLMFHDDCTPDLVEMADAMADIAVVNTGFMSLCGIQDEPLLKAVQDNNDLKLETGTICATTGKLLKAPDHPKPDIRAVLLHQGMTPSSTPSSPT